MRRFTFSNSAGFTLTELLVVTVIFTLVIASVLTLLSAGMDARTQAVESTSLQERAQAAADAIAMSVMRATQVVSATGGLQLLNPDDSLTVFSLSGGDLTRTENSTTTTIASNVSSLQLTMRDTSGAGTTIARNAARLDIRVSLATPAGTQVSVCSSARLRNWEPPPSN